MSESRQIASYRRPRSRGETLTSSSAFHSQRHFLFCLAEGVRGQRAGRMQRTALELAATITSKPQSVQTLTVNFDPFNDQTEVKSLTLYQQFVR